jgi:hypothetical protein
MKKCFSPSTMASHVETLFSFTAWPNAADSASMRASVRRSASSTARFFESFVASSSTASSSSVSESSRSFCSCICTEQSRPPRETHHSPLPMSWISLWRVVSMLSSMRKFRLLPGAITLDSARMSITAVATSASPDTTRCPLPPPPPMYLKRMRLPGCSFQMPAACARAVAWSSSIVTSSMTCS